MEAIEFYTRPNDQLGGLELTLKMGNPLPILPQDEEQLNKDWKERGYARSSPLGTLVEVSYNYRTGEAELLYLLTEYKIYSGIAFPALSDTEQKILPQLKGLMRCSAIGCAVQTSDEKIIVQRRKESLICGGMLDSGAAGMMAYNPSTGKLDWKQQTLEKLSRELNLTNASLSSLTAKAVFSSRGPAHVPALKGYYSGGYSGMVSSLALVNFSYDEVAELFDKCEVGEIIGVRKEDIAPFIVEQTTSGSRSLIADGCGTLLSLLPEKEFYETVEKLNSKENSTIRFGSLKEGIFIEEN